MILISAFEPFNNESLNPSSLVLDKLKSNEELVKFVLPVAYSSASKLLIDSIIKYKPRVVLMLGQAGGRRKVSLEYIAINIKSANIPDNEGVIIKDMKINEHGKDSYVTNFDLKSIISTQSDIDISYHAGTFICNKLLYEVLEFINSNHLDTKADFCHVPYIKEQTVDKPNVAYLELDDIIKTINKLIEQIEMK